jgi:hypothetical protein
MVVTTSCSWDKHRKLDATEWERLKKTEAATNEAGSCIAHKDGGIRKGTREEVSAPVE